MSNGKTAFNINQVARTTPFDNSTNGFTSITTQGAIEEVYNIASTSSRAFTFCQFNGNANAGRYVEFFSGIASNEAPLRVINALQVLTVVARTTAINATCTIGFYDITPVTPTLLYTATFSAVKELVLTGTPLFTVPANGKLAIKVDSGSISKPHIYLTGQGG